MAVVMVEDMAVDMEVDTAVIQYTSLFLIIRNQLSITVLAMVRKIEKLTWDKSDANLIFFFTVYPSYGGHYGPAYGYGGGGFGHGGFGHGGFFWEILKKNTIISFVLI